MKRSLFCYILILSMVMIFTACGGGSQSSLDDPDNVDEPILCRVVHCGMEGDIISTGFDYFKKVVEEKTQGKIAVEIHGNMSVSNSDAETAEMIRSNMMDVGIAPSFTLASMNSELSKFYIFDYPFMFKTMDEIRAFTKSEIGIALENELIEKTGNLKTYGPYTKNFYKISTKDIPITSPQSIKGLKIRCAPTDLHMGIVNALGANPTPVAIGEVFTALQQGTVDGLMLPVDLYINQRYYELQDEVAAINPVGLVMYPLVSNIWYEALPDELKVVFDECMVVFNEETYRLGSALEEESIEELRRLGVNITEYDEAGLKPFVDACMSLWDEKADVGGGKAFLDEVNSWLEDYRSK